MEDMRWIKIKLREIKITLYVMKSTINEKGSRSDMIMGKIHKLEGIEIESV